MTEVKSYSELFAEETDVLPSLKVGQEERHPDSEGNIEGPQGPVLQETHQGVSERPRHKAIIPGYEVERIKERKILTLRDLLYIFFKHLQSIGVVTAVCFTVAALFSFMATPQYKADTKILIRQGREKLSDVNEYSRNVNLFYQERNQDVNNELEVFKSDQLSRMVYEDLKDHFDQIEAETKKNILRLSLSHLKFILFGSKLSREEKEILALNESLKVEFLAETDILRISYSSPDPKFAATVANAYANAFLRLRTKIFEKKKSHMFYVDQIAQFRKKVDDLVDDEKVFSQKWQVSEIEKEKELILQSRENLEAERLKAQQDFDRSNALLISLKKMFDTPGDWIETPKMSENEMVDRQGYLQDIDRQYFTLKLEHSRLSGQFTDKSREIQQLDSSIAQLRKQKYLSLVNILTMTNKAREPVIKEFVAEIAKKNKRISELIQATYVVQLFKVNRTIALDTLVNYTKRAEELRIYDDLDKEKITSLSTINTATPPLEPYFPKKGLILLTATFFGVFLSFGLSAIKEFFTHVFRDGQDIERILKVPLLMSVDFRERSR